MAASSLWAVYLGVALHGVCYDFFFVAGAIYTGTIATPKGVNAQAQGMLTLFTYGVGMLLGSQIGALLYAQLPASPTIADWQHMWWYPAIAAAVIALLFQFTFRDDTQEDRSMTGMKGPGIFLAQFLGDTAPFDTLDGLAEWAAGLGYVGVQIPCNAQLIDLKLAAESKTYCDDLRGRLAGHGIEVTELSTHLQGQLVAVHPAYDTLFDGFAPPEVHGKPAERQVWAVEQVKLAARASANLGPDRACDLLGRAGMALSSIRGRNVPPGWSRKRSPNSRGAGSRSSTCSRRRASTARSRCIRARTSMTARPGSGSWTAVDNHPRARLLFDPSHFVLQQLDYLDFIDRYHDRISCFHVKDAEFNPTGRSGVYGGYENWVDRAGRFRSLGDGQVDFSSIFSKLAAIWL